VTSIWNNLSPDNVLKLSGKPVDVKGIGKRVFGTIEQSDWKSDLVQWKNWVRAAEHEARLISGHVYEIFIFVEKPKMNKTLD